MSAAPSLTALRAFEAFARHGSMTAAAAELCVTHGAVSRQVRLLQDQMGMALIAGPRNRPVLTEAGRTLADGLAEPFAAIRRAVATARAGGPRRIEVSCLGTFAMKWLIPRLSGFMAAHPEVTVQVSESHAPVDFRRQSCDAAIRILDHDTPSQEWTVTRFLPNAQGAVCAAAAARPDVTPADLFALPRLFSSTYPNAWRIWAEARGERLPLPTAEREFAHNHSLVEAVAAGLGAAVAPYAFVAPDLDAGRLAAPFGFIRQPSDFALLRPQGVHDALLDAFAGWLVEEGRRTPAPERRG